MFLFFFNHFSVLIGRGDVQHFVQLAVKRFVAKNGEVGFPCGNDLKRLLRGINAESFLISVLSAARYSFLPAILMRKINKKLLQSECRSERSENLKRRQNFPVTCIVIVDFQRKEACLRKVRLLVFHPAPGFRIVFEEQRLRGVFCRQDTDFIRFNAFVTSVLKSDADLFFTTGAA